jgi:hypothetical protein
MKRFLIENSDEIVIFNLNLKFNYEKLCVLNAGVLLTSSAQHDPLPVPIR